MTGVGAPATTVGLCEDDETLREILRTTLQRSGHRVRAAGTGGEAVRLFAERPPDVIVLDIGLPDADGRDVCQALRARGVAAPVIFLTARDALADRLSGFHAGGDDYLAKPFALSELDVRVSALLRRGERRFAAGDGEPPAGEFLDPSTHAVVGAVTVALTPTEYRLLASLCAARGTIVHRHALLAAGWPQSSRVADNTLDAYVSRLRGKLRQARRRERLENIRGVGYRLR